MVKPGWTVSVNEDQLRLEWQRHILLIPFVDRGVGGRQNSVIPRQSVPYLSASVARSPREEALYQV